MKLANSIKISVFIKPEEDSDALTKAFMKLFPFNLEEEKIIVRTSKATSFSQRQITIREVELSKDKHTNIFLKHLKEKLDEQQRKMLISQEDRLDENLNFFIRLDKESLLHDQYQVTDCGECYHIRISIAAFPRKREAALEVVKRIFG
jgi:RNA binding exosome subunit